MTALNSAAPVEPGSAIEFAHANQIATNSSSVLITHGHLLPKPVVDRGNMAGQFCIRNPFETLLRRHLRPRYSKLRGNERCGVFPKCHRYSSSWVRRTTALAMARALITGSSPPGKFAALQCKNLRRTASMVDAA